MAPANSAAPLAAEVAGGRLLLCEFCDFSSGHWSSVRRHYMNIHGKKVHRCRDCCFFTGLRWELSLRADTLNSESQLQLQITKRRPDGDVVHLALLRQPRPDPFDPHALRQFLREVQKVSAETQTV